MLRPLLLAIVTVACASAPVQEESPAPGRLTLERIMSEPEWIGRFPSGAYWGPDSGTAYFYRSNPHDDGRDLQTLDVETGRGRVVEDWELGVTPAASFALDPTRTRRLESRGGDLFLVELESGEERQLTRTEEREVASGFGRTPDRVVFRRGDRVFVRDLATGLETEPVVLAFEDDPDEDEDEADHLEEQQERLFESLRVREERREGQRERRELARELDPTRAPPTLYLGDGKRLAGIDLSPSERFALVRVSETGPRAERVDVMPDYVTESSWVETRDVRPHVGWRTERPEELVLVDLTTREHVRLDLSPLPGILEDPHAEEGAAPREEPRALWVFGVRWSPDGSRVVFMARSQDNKDRWIAEVDLAQRKVVPLHRYRDEAWVTYRFNEFDWLRDGSGVWFTSEESGWSQLYRWDAGSGEVRALTEGEFEVDQVSEDPDGGTLWFRANVDDPTVHEICRVSARGGDMEVVTRLGGRTSGVLSPDGERLLLTHSKAVEPPELWVQDARPGAEPRRLTSFVSEDFERFDWVAPEFVEVTGDDGRVIRARVYLPEGEPGDALPLVAFVHGAGYLQNAHRGWSGYFREFMFHSFLVQEGYAVIDVDYRGSAGYGRDWRTAIYRHMGSVELEDYLAVIDWMATEHPIDPDRIGMYGGSYGGFLTLMALFNQPGLYRCGAALRPVTDWSHYNHGYTSNILNTPQLDPEAFRRSSPIEFAEGLEDALLICHGMLDDNVLAKDSIRLAQRLIELEKEDWELALYPVEGHAFREPSSWLDEYRRVFALFERHLK